MEIKVIVRWLTKDQDAIRLIREHFNLPTYTTLNGFTPGALKQEDIPMFEETARRGFFAFEYTEWRAVGNTYQW